MLGATLLLAGLLAGAVTMAALVQPTVRQPSTRPTLNIVTANIRYSAAKDGDDAWIHRKQGLLQRLHDLDPDFLGAQEVLADQYETLCADFPAHALVGVAREDGKRKGEFAPLLLYRDRFEIKDSGTFWLSPTPDLVASKGWDASLTRICSWAMVTDLTNGKELVLANTHFDHLGEKAREESAKLIASRLPAKFPDRPMILTGDFNATDTSSAYTTIIAAGLIDAYREVHPNRKDNEATFHGFKGTTKGARIDFIFHTPQFKTISAEIDREPIKPGRWPSDHFFVKATLGWR